MQRYVILEQAQPDAMVFTRKGNDWLSEVLTTQNATLDLPEIGCSIPLTECYIDLDLGSQGKTGAA